jgi:hypothetical protein
MEYTESQFSAYAAWLVRQRCIHNRRNKLVSSKKIVIEAEELNKQVNETFWQCLFQTGVDMLQEALLSSF